MNKYDKDCLLQIRLSKTQIENLRNKADQYGFVGISDYVRFQLFLTISPLEKIDKIYKTICEKNGQ